MRRPPSKLAMYFFREERAGSEPGARNILPTSEVGNAGYRTKKWVGYRSPTLAALLMNTHSGSPCWTQDCEKKPSSRAVVEPL
jgi:hypothetical protein